MCCYQNINTTSKFIKIENLMINLSSSQTYFLPVIGLVDPEEMKPADLVVSSYY
jgi:hypothetical protein